MSHEYFATCAKGLTGLLADELRALGAQGVREVSAGVRYSGALELGYRSCLWLRTASRVLLQVAHFDVEDTDALYAGVRAFDWDDHLPIAGSLAVDVAGRHPRITHSQFAAQRVKDAIVDQQRARHRRRPNVDLDAPDLRINVFLERTTASVAIDLSGQSLHRRGYREDSVAAPIKENLAAAILLRAGWPAIAAAGGSGVDPMCGSGTLLIEAAWMAGDRAPQLRRSHFGFERWQSHVPALWREILAEAEQRADAGRDRIPNLYGYDADPAAVRAARDNAAAASVADRLRIECRAVAEIQAPPTGCGLVMVNPPYGERLGSTESLQPLYAQLGSTLRTEFQGWQAAVLTGNPSLGRALGIVARRAHTFYNGAIECRLLRLEVTPDAFEPSAEARAIQAAERALSAGAQMFANRIRKNLARLGRWAARNGIDCYRLYDADMPEYAVAVDVYQGAERHLHVQEYAAPKTVDANAARQRLREVLAALPALLEVPRERIHFKRRERQRAGSQYEKLATRGEFQEVREGPCRFLVNFTDYLDTGLFLDHRLTRALVAELCRGRDLLNLFCYTATASVHAALGGAVATTSVDMSATYLDWARRNFALNALTSARHALVQADCLAWLVQQAADRRAPRYGVIFLDPPTFSTSKRMAGTLDVQRDHVSLIHNAAALLASDGVLVFATNHQRFKLDAAALGAFQVADISRQTLPKDFERNPRIHRVWRMTRR